MVLIKIKIKINEEVFYKEYRIFMGMNYSYGIQLIDIYCEPLKWTDGKHIGPLYFLSTKSMINIFN